MQNARYDMPEYNAACQVAMEKIAPSPDVARFMSDLEQRIRNATEHNTRVASAVSATPTYTNQAHQSHHAMEIVTPANSGLDAGSTRTPAQSQSPKARQTMHSQIQTHTTKSSLQVPKWVMISAAATVAVLIVAVVIFVVLYALRRKSTFKVKAKPPVEGLPAATVTTATESKSSEAVASRVAAGRNQYQQHQETPAAIKLIKVSSQHYQDASRPMMMQRGMSAPPRPDMSFQQHAMQQPQNLHNVPIMQVQVTNAQALTPEQQQATMDALNMSLPEDTDDDVQYPEQYEQYPETGGHVQVEQAMASNTSQYQGRNQIVSHKLNDHGLGYADVSENGNRVIEPALSSRHIAEISSGHVYNTEQLSEQRLQLPPLEKTNLSGNARDIELATIPLEGM